MKLFFVFILSITLLGCGGSGSGSPPNSGGGGNGGIDENLTTISVLDVDFEFVDIPAGAFSMGSNDGEPDEQPIHEVSVPAFKMMTTEITQAQWTTIMAGTNRENITPYFSECGDDCPMEHISYEFAQQFVTRLNELSSHNVRLPTEAEWEYAARAGSTTQFSWGDEPDCSKARFGYYEGGECGNDYDGPAPAKSYPANAFGLYDMHGSVFEWTQDCRNTTYTGAPKDGSVWTRDNCYDRITRGGAWGSRAENIRSAYRFWSSVVLWPNYFGFRLVLEN